MLDIKVRNATAIVSNQDGCWSVLLAGITKVQDQITSQTDRFLCPPGYTWDGVIHKMPSKQWQAMLEVHLTAPFRLIQAATPHMRDAAKAEIERDGKATPRSIINVSSTSGTHGNAGQVNYGTVRVIQLLIDNPCVLSLPCCHHTYNACCCILGASCSNITHYLSEQPTLLPSWTPPPSLRPVFLPLPSCTPCCITCLLVKPCDRSVWLQLRCNGVAYCQRLLY